MAFIKKCLNNKILYLFMAHFTVTILCACDCSEKFGCDCRNSLGNVLMMQKIDVLTLRESTSEILNADNFTNFKDTVVDLYLNDLFNLKCVENNTFNEFSNLRTLHFTRAPMLNHLSLDILEKNPAKLRILEVTYTGIMKVPRLRLRNEIMKTIDLEGNAIQVIETNSISVKAAQIIFKYNKITTVEAWAFNNSEISEIYLKGNSKLRVLSEQAFLGLKSLTILDLSETSVSNIPTVGLQSLETLIIQHTYSLKTIPSIYDFANLKAANLTFSFHCCAFDLPWRHDPQKYALHKIMMENMKRICPEALKIPPLAKIDSFDLDYHAFGNSSDEEEWHGRRRRRSALTLDELKNKTHLVALCGNVPFGRERVTCYPIPNAFNPCEDIMGYKWLRFCVWFVVITGLCGNTCVLAVILGKPAEITVQNFLISNLAFSDLCMAIFLCMLAVEDLFSRDNYFNYAYDWQQGFGCKVAGFVTVFSCQLSIFILCLLTVERWFSIKKALYINQLTFRRTALIAVIGWLYALMMATLPLLGISSYSTTSLCLPMKTETALDVAYVLLLLFLAFAAFVTICICYFQIYFSLSYETRHKDGEYVLARKMSILVATNFTCWAPITFFALTAVLGFPLINVTNSKILLVFFYPLNSCANPFLYAILTTNFKRDFVYLLSKFGICKKTARNYKLIFYQPKGNHTHRIQRPLTSSTSL